MLILIYNRIISINEKIENLPFLTEEDYKKLSLLTPKMFLVALDALNYLEGELL
jgi:hypothetical protein